MEETNLKDVEKWSVEQVVQWAAEIIKPEYASKLKDQEVVGKALLKLNAASLERCGIPVGPAAILADEIEKLKGLTTKQVEWNIEYQTKRFKTGRRFLSMIHGVDKMKGCVTSRSETVTFLKEKIDQNLVVHIASSPMTGKTALCQLLYEELKSRCRVLSFTFPELSPLIQQSGKSFLKFYQEYFNEELVHTLSGNTIILLDESQRSYDDASFWSVIKKFSEGKLELQKSRVVIFAQYNTKVAKSPFDFPCRLGSELMMGKDSEVEELFEDFNNIQNLYGQATLPNDGYIRKCLCRITSWHLGLLNLTLQELQKHWSEWKLYTYSQDETIKYLLGGEYWNKIKGCRAYYSPDTLTTEHVDILKQIILKREVNVGQLGSEDLNKINDLTKLGILNNNELIVSFSCSLIRRMYLHDTERGALRSTNSMPKSLVELVYLTITLINPEEFKSNHSLNADGMLSEDFWQKYLYRIFLNLLPQCTINVEFPSLLSSSVKPKKSPKKKFTMQEKKRRVNKKGSLDFYFDNNLRWQLEILRQGDDLIGHRNRFNEDNGSYRFIPRNEYLVVDFRHESLLIKEYEKKLTNTLIVSYNDQYTKFNVYHSETGKVEKIKPQGNLSLKMSGMLK